MAKRYRYTNRVADEAVAKADNAPSTPRDRPRTLANPPAPDELTCRRLLALLSVGTQKKTASDLEVAS